MRVAEEWVESVPGQLAASGSSEPLGIQLGANSLYCDSWNPGAGRDKTQTQQHAQKEENVGCCCVSELLCIVKLGLDSVVTRTKSYLEV